MTETGKHPAIFAGLLGSAVWGGAPTIALASPVDQAFEAVSQSVVLQFVVGCTIGAAFAGVFSLIMDAVAYRRAVAAQEAADEAEFWKSSSLNLLQAEDEVGEDDPTGDLGRFRTGQMVIELPTITDKAVATPVYKPRHYAQFSAAQETKHTSRSAGKHFAGTADTAKPVVTAHEQAPSRGRHFKGSTPQQGTKFSAATPAPVTSKANRVAPAANAPMPASAPELHGRARLAQLPVIESRRVAVRAPHAAVAPVMPSTYNAATLDSNDLTRAAQMSASKSVGSRTHSAHAGQKTGLTGRIRMQMTNRAKSVRAVLAERLGSEALDGVPIIQRADGSTQNIEPTWFDQNVAPTIASITGVTPRLQDTAPRLGEEAAAPHAATETPSRASYIANRVAEVNVGVFPELRTGDELGEGDVFEQALAAMGESIAQSTPREAFQDMVGGPATIDDPDGLEGPTGFIPFRVPAAHPEVVDTDTYVDYLLRDEISINGSQVLSRSPIAHLRVIEGGTGKINMQRRAEETAPKAKGRHFAQPMAYAKEA